MLAVGGGSADHDNDRSNTSVIMNILILSYNYFYYYYYYYYYYYFYVLRGKKREVCPEESRYTGRANDFAFQPGFRFLNLRPSVLSWSLEGTGRANGFAILLGFGRSEIWRPAQDHKRP